MIEYTVELGYRKYKFTDPNKAFGFATTALISRADEDEDIEITLTKVPDPVAQADESNDDVVVADEKEAES